MHNLAGITHGRSSQMASCYCHNMSLKDKGLARCGMQQAVWKKDIKLEYSSIAVEHAKLGGVTQEKQLKYPNCANLWFIYNVIQALSKTKLLNVQKQRKGKNLREKAQSKQAYTKKDE